MKKNLIVLTPFLFLIACSSSPKKDDMSLSSGTSSSSSSSSPSLEEIAATQPGSDVTKAREAIADKPKVVATPSSSSLSSNLSDAIKSGNDERIYQAATQVLTQAPNDPRALNALAMYHYKRGRTTLARYLISKAISSSPQVAGLYSNLGLIQLSQDESREAIQSFRKALELDSNDGIAAANLGSIYTQNLDYTKAAMLLEIAMNKNIRDPKVMNNYGIAMTAVGKYDKAESAFKSILKDNSSNKEILFNYAILLIDHMSKFQDGLDVLNRLKFVGGPAESRNRIIALENKAKAGLK
jgi:Flp pilus assembly protein TadD